MDRIMKNKKSARLRMITDAQDYLKIGELENFRIHI
jgi:hypothetical protein